MKKIKMKKNNLRNNIHKVIQSIFSMNINDKIMRFKSTQQKRYNYFFWCVPCRYQSNSNASFVLHKATKRCGGENNWFLKMKNKGHNNYFLIIHKYHYVSVIHEMMNVKKK